MLWEVFLNRVKWKRKRTTKSVCEAKKYKSTSQNWKDMEQNVNMSISNDEIIFNFFLMLLCIIIANNLLPRTYLSTL